MLFLYSILVSIASGQELGKIDKIGELGAPTDEKTDMNDYYKEHYSYFQDNVGFDSGSVENYVKYPAYYSKDPRVFIPLPSVLDMYPGPVSKSTLEPLIEEPVSEEPVPEHTPILITGKDDNKTKSVVFKVPRLPKETSFDYENENDGWLTESYEQVIPDNLVKQFPTEWPKQTKKIEKTEPKILPIVPIKTDAQSYDQLTQFMNLKPNTSREEIDKHFSKIELNLIPENFKNKFISKLIELRYLFVDDGINKKDQKSLEFPSDLILAKPIPIVESTGKKSDKVSNEDIVDKLEVSDSTDENAKKNNVTIQKEKSEKYTIRNGNDMTVIETKHSVLAKKFKVNDKSKIIKSKETKKNNIKKKIETPQKKFEMHAKVKPIEIKERIFDMLPLPNEENIYNSMYDDFSKRAYRNSFRKSPWDLHSGRNWRSDNGGLIFPPLPFGAREKDTESAHVGPLEYLPFFTPSTKNFYYIINKERNKYKKSDDLSGKVKLPDINLGKKLKIFRSIF